MGIAIGVLLLSTLSAPPMPAAAEPNGPPKCWVSWRPSTGSVHVENTKYNLTKVVFRLKWRAEDLTFTTCRARTAIELETFLRTNRNVSSVIDSTDLPRAYVDSSMSGGEITFGVGDAEKLVPDKNYKLTLMVNHHLERNDTLVMSASRGYRLQRCPGPDSVCVNGWIDEDKFGPASRIRIFDTTRIQDGTTIAWSYPSRSTLMNHILRDPAHGDSYLLDDSGIRHWIPDGATYNCLVSHYFQVVNEFAGLNQRWVIRSFSQGSNATCDDTPLPPTPSPPSSSSPSPTPSPSPPPQSGGGALSLTQGAAAPRGYWYDVTLSGFSANQSVTVTCRDSVSPGGFYDQTFTTDASGQASDSTLCYSNDHPEHWVTAGDVESNHVNW